MEGKTTGVLSVLFASLMWVIESILAKLAHRKADFLETSAIRALFVVLVAFTYGLFTDPSGLKVERKRLPVLLYLAIAGILVADLLNFLGIRTCRS